MNWQFRYISGGFRVQLSRSPLIWSRILLCQGLGDVIILVEGIARTAFEGEKKEGLGTVC